MQVDLDVSGSVRVTNVLADTKLPRIAGERKRICQQKEKENQKDR